MSYKLKVTLQGAVPKVTRTIAVPTHFNLNETASAIITSMGWNHRRPHAFVTGVGTPSENEVDDEVVTLASDLRDSRCVFVYDDFGGWIFDLEFQKDVDTEGPKVVRYSGDSPPGIFAGVRDWNTINRAASDPDDPYHEQARAWSTFIEPYDTDAVNARLADPENGNDMGFHIVDRNDDAFEAMLKVMGNAQRLMESVAPIDGFRCPFCGAQCDGRLDTSGNTTEMRGMKRYPVVTVCPVCMKRSRAEQTNDGYSRGYCMDKCSRPLKQCIPYYDMLETRDEPRHGADRARFLAGMRLAEERYRIHDRTDMDAVVDAMSELDPSDPEQADVMTMCIESVVRGNRDPAAKSLLDDAENMEDCLRGAYGAALLCRIAGTSYRNTDRFADLTERALDVLSVKEDDSIHDLLLALHLITDNAFSIEDRDLLPAIVDRFDTLVSKVLSDLDGMESTDWSALCYMFEALCHCTFFSERTDLTERAVKIMSGPFADGWHEGIPAAVRNIVRFRRAMLFLSTDGDREQASDDLKSICESMRKLEENGPMTGIRTFFAEAMLVSMRKDEPRMLGQSLRSVTGQMDFNGMARYLMYTIEALAGSGMKSKQVERFLLNLGFGLGRKLRLKGDERLEPDEVWEVPELQHA